MSNHIVVLFLEQPINPVNKKTIRPSVWVVTNQKTRIVTLMQDFYND